MSRNKANAACERQESLSFVKACGACATASGGIFFALLGQSPHEEAGRWAIGAAFTSGALLAIAFLWWVTDSRAHDGPIRWWGAGVAAMVTSALAALSHVDPGLGFFGVLFCMFAVIVIARMPSGASRMPANMRLAEECGGRPQRRERKR